MRNNMIQSKCMYNRSCMQIHMFPDSVPHMIPRMWSRIVPSMLSGMCNSIPNRNRLYNWNNSCPHKFECMMSSIWKNILPNILPNIRLNMMSNMMTSNFPNMIRNNRYILRKLRNPSILLSNLRRTLLNIRKSILPSRSLSSLNSLLM